MERAVLDVLPEVVEGVLRNALNADPRFREIVERAVERAVADQVRARNAR
jgi:hypothetical protein